MKGSKLLTFKIGEEDYGIGILKVQEIRRWEPPTPVAESPKFIKGVINLRGVIVPIVDLRVKFGVEAPRYDEHTVVIILGVASGVIGVVVDAVSDVVALEEEDIHPAPAFGASAGAGFITGIGTTGERMLILADMERLLPGGLAASRVPNSMEGVS